MRRREASVFWRPLGIGGVAGCVVLLVGSVACEQDAPAKPDPYTVPGDFDRTGCDTSGFADVHLEGIWTTWFSPPSGGGGLGVFMHRFSSTPLADFDDAPVQTSSGLRGWFNGKRLDVITQRDGLLHWWRASHFEDGTRSLVAFVGCRIPGPDAIEGLVATCDGVPAAKTPCRPVTTFRADRLTRNAGEVEAEGLAKVAELRGADWGTGPFVNVRVAGGRGFLVGHRDGLRILDISRAADHGVVAEIAHVPSRNDEVWNDVKVVGGRWALLASSARGMVVVDAGDPAAAIPPAPTIAVGRFPDGPHPENVHSIFVEGSTAYLADITRNGIVIADVSDPARPRQTGEYKLMTGGTRLVHDLYVQDRVAYLNYWTEGLVMVDVSDPAAPRKLGHYRYDGAASHGSWLVAGAAVGGGKVLVHGDEGWGAHLRMIDVDPASPTFMIPLGSFRIRDQVSVHNITCAGARCAVTHYQDGVRIVDVSAPSDPRQVGYFNTWRGDRGKDFFEGAVGIDVSGDLIYVADAQRGLIVLRALR